jgi:hypothetical protein
MTYLLVFLVALLANLVLHLMHRVDKIAAKLCWQAAVIDILMNNIAQLEKQINGVPTAQPVAPEPATQQDIQLPPDDPQAWKHGIRPDGSRVGDE